MTKRRLWLLRVLTVLVVLVALEGMARVYRVFVPVPEVGYGYPPGLFTWDPLSEYRCTPGFRGFFRGPLFGDIPIRINAEGYRDEEFSAARAPGLQRIAFLGDSVTFGSGVRAEERFADRLRAEAQGPLETQNFAVNAYAAWHYAQQARGVLPRFQPDLVVLGLTLDDLDRKGKSWPRKTVVAPDGSYVGEYRRPGHRERLRTSELSAFLSITSELETRWRNRDPWRAWMRAAGAEWSDPERRAALREHLAAVRDALAPTPLLVLVLPEAHDLADPERFGMPRRTALAMLDELGIAHIDVYEDFRRDPDWRSFFLPDDSIHLTPQGHARIAALLRAWLESERVTARSS